MSAHPRPGKDLLIALGLGALTAAAAYLVLGPNFLDGHEITEDFLEYCAVIRWARDGAPAAMEPLLMRQVALGLPTALVADQTGIIPAMRLTSMACAVGLGAALYLWGLVLHGRAAGVAACLTSLAMVPLLLLPRHLTFYPQFTLATTLCGLAASLALRWPRPLTLCLGSAAMGLLLLADQTGLFFAPFFMLALVVAAVRAVPADAASRGRRLASVAAAMLLPLALSWMVAAALPAPRLHSALDGQAASPRASLESRMAYHLQAHLRKNVSADEEGLIWGHSGPGRWLSAAISMPGMLLMANQSPNFQKVAANPERDLSRRQLLPWLATGGLALMLVMGLRWRGSGWRPVLDLLLVLLPFLLYLLFLRGLTLEHSAQVEHNLGHPVVEAGFAAKGYYFIRAKFLMVGLVPVALLLGTAWAAMVSQASRLARWAPAVVSVLLLALLGGLMGPAAPWKMRYRGSDFPVRLEQRARADKLGRPIDHESFPLFVNCARGVQDDLGIKHVGP